MVKNFSGYRWRVCSGKSNRTAKPKLNKGVYVIAIQSPSFDKMILAYIGVSSNLSRRLYSHPILRHIRNNYKSHSEIMVLYRKFSEEDSVNRKAESVLIKKHMPPFNYTPYFTKEGRKIVSDFWDKIKGK